MSTDEPATKPVIVNIVVDVFGAAIVLSIAAIFIALLYYGKIYDEPPAADITDISCPQAPPEDPE